MARYAVIDRCRSCRGRNLVDILSLGEMPLADALVGEDRLAGPEDTYPLTVAFCPDCSLVQIRETVPPSTLFGEDYPYYSSFSDALLEHSRANVATLIADLGLGSDDLAVEIASNDGYLLQFFARAGVKVLGIDPAPGPAAAARERGIPTRVEFFDLALARRLRADGTRASVIIGNNVLAHVPDQNDVVAGMAELLADDGVAVVEVPYVKDLVDHCEFDTIYHEHHCYFSVTALARLFRHNGLPLVSVEHLSIHGGSLRCRFARHLDPDPSVEEYLTAEERAGLTRLAYYQEFADRVEEVKRNLRKLLGELKAGGNRIAAYGAAAKGATLLNYTGIGTDVLDYVVDRNVHKQGRYMPGVHLPIRAPEVLVEDRPDYLLLLAWNFKDEIMAQQQAYAAAGGRFIVPIPTPEVVG